MELTVDYNSTDINVIPKDWNRLPLGDAIRIQSGYAFKSERYTDIGVPIIRISDIQDHFVEITNSVYYPEILLPLMFKVFEGDILIAMSGATTGKVGVYINSTVAYQNQRVGKFVILDTSKTDPKFINQLVQSSTFRLRLNIFLEQGAQPNISGKQIESLLFAFPSTIAEQTIIASTLIDVDALVNNLEKLITKKRNLKQGTVQALLSGKKRLPGFSRKWEEKKLSETSTLKARIGWQGLTTAEYLDQGDYILVTGTDFQDGVINWDSCHYVDENRYSQDKNIQLKPNDILVTKDGTIGKVAYISQVPKPATLNSGIFVIRPKDNNYLPHFFYYLLNSIYFERFLNQLSAGSTIVHLYQKDFIHFVFPLPPTLEEQEAIVQILSEMDAEIEQLERKLSKYKMIKQGMMQNLLTGKIRLI